MAAIRLRRRTILAIAVIVLVGIGSGYYAWSLLNPPKPGAIRVGWPGPIKYPILFPVEIASRLLRDQGVNLTVTTFRSYAEGYAALTRGDLDIFISNIDVVTNAINQNVSVKAILGAYEISPWVLVVSSNVSDAQQLRGKTIAAFARLSMDDVILRRLLFQQAGMQAGQDYFIVYMPGTGARVPALLAGTIDASILGPETVSKVMRENPGRFKVWANLYEYMPRMTAVVWVATEQTIREHPEVVRFFAEYMIRAHRQAYSYGVDQLAALYSEFDPSITLEDSQAAFRLYVEARTWPVNGGLSRELWDEGSQFILREGFVANVVSYDRAVDDSILNEVLARLGSV